MVKFFFSNIFHLDKWNADEDNTLFSLDDHLILCGGLPLGQFKFV